MANNEKTWSKASSEIVFLAISVIMRVFPSLSTSVHLHTTENCTIAQEGQKKILKDATCKFWAGAL